MNITPIVEFTLPAIGVLVNSTVNDINATISVNGLTQKGQIVSAEYTVQNVSTDISADLSVATTNSNTEYFTLKSELAKTSLTAGEATTVKVSCYICAIRYFWCSCELYAKI